MAIRVGGRFRFTVIPDTVVVHVGKDFGEGDVIVLKQAIDGHHRIDRIDRVVRTRRGDTCIAGQIREGGCQPHNARGGLNVVSWCEQSSPSCSTVVRCQT